MKFTLPSTRTLHRNIWRALLSASDTEIREGLSFYWSANWFCSLVARLYSIPCSNVAGVYAALSPRNTWRVNEANTLEIVRFCRGMSEGDVHSCKVILDRIKEDNDDDIVSTIGEFPRVCTSNTNRDKAIRIACGEDPSRVLKGRKVTAFWRAMADPYDTSPIPVDAHLINLTLGVFPDKATQSHLASSRDVYDAVESAYTYLGNREGIGNRVASIAWFVQRRVSRSGQQLMPYPGSFCCGKPVWSHKPYPNRSFRCSVCGKSRGIVALESKLPRPEGLQLDIDVPYAIHTHNGYPALYLPIDHPFRTRDARCYLNRYVVMSVTGELLHRHEHVHHRDENKLNCTRDNLQVLVAREHGRYHYRRHMELLYSLRDLATNHETDSRLVDFEPDEPKLDETVARELDDVPF